MRKTTHPIAAMAVFLLMGSLLLLGSNGLVMAGEYPTKPIRLIYPFPAGSGGDVSTRILADVVSKVLKKPVKVSNVTGGRGTLGASTVARARKGGYELGSLPTGPAVTQTVFNPQINYKPSNFDPIVQFTYFPIVLVAGADKPYKTVPELVAYAKKNPGKVSFAHPGQGSIPYLMMKALETQSGIKLTGIPFKGLAPGVAAAVGGHVDIAVAVYAGVLGFKKAGKLNILGLFAGERLKFAPEVPTVKEDGIKTYPQNWCGIFGPKGMDPAVRKKLEEAFTKAVKSPEFVAAMEKIQLPVEYLNSKDFAAKIKRDVKYYNQFKVSK
ncbi:MAG: tripartite tricarboxylate transporter substrate binding protein [Deltaproteobacteria bacterium]|nr:tripartite tricarboxylate transporter substrate binding protein [Deltaproteobacteria bacterium]